MKTIGDRMFPWDYIDFQLCRELHYTPQELDDMPEATYQLWVGFMQAEAHNDRMEKERQAFLHSK